jgi:hypothetical protein
MYSTENENLAYQNFFPSCAKYMLLMEENQKKERTMFLHKHFIGSEWKLGVFLLDH